MEQINKYFTFGKQVGITFAANIVIAALAIIQIPIITRGLGSSLYGTWAIINASISVLTPFIMLSFNMSIVRFLAAENDASKIRDDFLSACSLVFLLGVVLSLLCFLFSGFLADLIFNDTTLSPFIKLSSVLILLNSLFPVLTAFFRKGSNIGTYNLFTFGLSIIQVVLTILAVSLGYGLQGVIIANIISVGIFNIIVMFVIVRQIGFQQPRFINMKAYLKWGIPLTPNSAILWMIHSSDRYIVSYFLGVSAAGIYSAANGIGSFAAFGLAPVGIVLYPIVSKSYDEGNLDQCRKYLKYSFKYLMMISIPAAVGLSVLAKPLLRVLTTPEFMTGDVVIIFVAFAAVLNCFYQICLYIIHLIGKTQITIRLLSTAAVLNIILNLILVRPMGIAGAGIASLVAVSVLGILTLLVTRRYLKFDLDIPFLLKSLFSSIVMALFIWLLQAYSIIMIVISIVVGVIIYFGILLLVRGLSRVELAFFVSFTKSFFKKV